MRLIKQWVALAVSALMLLTGSYVMAAEDQAEVETDSVFESNLRF